MSNKTYDFLKGLAMVGFPCAGSIFLILNVFWTIPSLTELLGSVVIFATILGLILKISSVAYFSKDSNFDGKMIVIPTDNGGKTFSLELHDYPEFFLDKEVITFKVVPQK